MSFNNDINYHDVYTYVSILLKMWPIFLNTEVS
jgi:hypothetical protein